VTPNLLGDLRPDLDVLFHGDYGALHPVIRRRGRSRGGFLRDPFGRGAGDRLGRTDRLDGFRYGLRGLRAGRRAEFFPASYTGTYGGGPTTDHADEFDGRFDHPLEPRRKRGTVPLGKQHSHRPSRTVTAYRPRRTWCLHERFGNL
jgi:hypothetical protein